MALIMTNSHDSGRTVRLPGAMTKGFVAGVIRRLRERGKTILLITPTWNWPNGSR
jgi:hypothetical protein